MSFHVEGVLTRGAAKAREQDSVKLAPNKSHPKRNDAQHFEPVVTVSFLQIKTQFSRAESNGTWLPVALWIWAKKNKR
jgi:hypothetical protein